jgi:hypothetical protein
MCSLITNFFQCWLFLWKEEKYMDLSWKIHFKVQCYLPQEFSKDPYSKLTRPNKSARWWQNNCLLLVSPLSLAQELHEPGKEFLFLSSKIGKSNYVIWCWSDITQSCWLVHWRAQINAINSITTSLIFQLYRAIWRINIWWRLEGNERFPSTWLVVLWKYVIG